MTQNAEKNFEWKEGISLSLYKDSLGYISRITMYHNKDKVGFVQINQISGKSIVTMMKVFDNFRDQGYGSQLVEALNGFLDSKQLDGNLKNAILGLKENQKDVYKFEKSGIYERHGWTPVSPDSELLERKFIK